MDNKKTSKKALKGLIQESIQEAINSLELPQSGKKVKKLIERNSKKLAGIYANILKREDKKKQKAEKFMEDAVKGKKTKTKKTKTKSKVKTDKLELQTA